ncbi:zinc transporter ZupT [compost metagenome]
MLCALGTAIGALPVLVVRSMPSRVADTLLGFGAGVMLAATAFSLLLPALDAAERLGGSAFTAALQVSLGLALGIALQDIPEGLAVALVLAGAGMSRGRAMLVGVASGVVEPLFSVLCAWLVGISQMILPWGLAAAAGAMLFVVAREIIPESQRHGHAGEATLGLIVGFCLMMVLDTSLG